MKKIFGLGLILIQSALGFSQACETYFPFKKGSSFELQSLDDKGKPVSRMVYRIKDAKEISGNLEAEVHNDIYDSKEKLASSADYKIQCKNGDLLIDMRSFMSPEMMNQFKNMEMKIQDAFIDIPSNPEVGSVLKDGIMNAEMYSDGKLFSKVNIELTNRKVAGKESVTIPAGTFNAVKISYDIKIESETMGIKIPMQFSAVEWYVKGVGPVKSESYGKNGKLRSATVMTKTPN